MFLIEDESHSILYTGDIRGSFHFRNLELRINRLLGCSGDMVG